eukprot:600958-Alexandrium_andersonii.AAC.1
MGRTRAPEQPSSTPDSESVRTVPQTGPDESSGERVRAVLSSEERVGTLARSPDPLAKVGYLAPDPASGDR